MVYAQGAGRRDMAARIFCLILWFFCGMYIFQLGDEEDIVVDIDSPIRNVSDKFLSVTLDTELIRNGLICLVSSAKLVAMATHLAPSYLRVGGTDADMLIFKADGVPQNDCHWRRKYPASMFNANRNLTNFTMTGHVWNEVNQFAKRAGSTLIFDLNVLLRNNGAWNSSNAEELLKFSHYEDVVWQLGNEPNSFRHVFGTPVGGQELGRDFRRLRLLLSRSPRYRRALLVGPDVTRPKHLGVDSIKYLRDFLSSCGNSTLDAVTWHQYYLNGRTATIQDFINPSILNILKLQIRSIKNAVTTSHLDVPIWLSETSSAYGGGAPGLSNSFVAGFLWLDKLGVAAQMGIDVVIRQSLYYGEYALLDINTLDPLPDWWLSVLYKQLVGHTVLVVRQKWYVNGAIRMYAHCASNDLKVTPGRAITLFGMNLKNTQMNINLKGLLPIKKVIPSISSYILTAESGKLNSKYVLLNGRRLQLEKNGSLPDFQPLALRFDSPLPLPPHSLAFWVINGVHAPACYAEGKNGTEPIIFG